MTPVLTRDRGLALLAVATTVVAAALVAVVPAPPAAPEPAEPEQVPVTRAVLGCTALHDSGSSFWSAVAPVPGAAARGTVRRVRPDDGTVVVEATGTGAVGLVAWRADRGRGSAATTACPAPRTSWWFGGAGGGLDHHSEVVLTNVDEGPAVVDLDLVGTTGEVDEAAMRGITVQGGTARVVRLIDVAPRSDEVTVHVATTQGRVVAQVRDVVRVPSGVGSEWLPPSAPPGTDLRLVGLPSVADRRTLLVTNPSERQALVTAQVVTQDGAFVPTGADEVSVDPGAVVGVDITAAVARDFAALRVRSDVAVLATVRSRLAWDIAYAGATDVATGFLAAPTTGGVTTLLLQGADAATGGTVSAWSTAGRRVATRGLSVPPSGLVTWTVPRGSAYVVLEPDAGRGEVHAAVVTTGTGVTGLPLVEVPTTQRRPVVVMRTE